MKRTIWLVAAVLACAPSFGAEKAESAPGAPEKTEAAVRPDDYRSLFTRLRRGDRR